jgi:WD40 repeat protein
MKSAIRELEAQKGERLIDLRRRYNASILSGGAVVVKGRRIGEKSKPERIHNNEPIVLDRNFEVSHCGRYVYIAKHRDAEIKIYDTINMKLVRTIELYKQPRRGSEEPFADTEKHVEKILKTKAWGNIQKKLYISCLAVSPDGTIAVGTDINAIEIFSRKNDGGDTHPQKYRRLSEEDILDLHHVKTLKGWKRGWLTRGKSEYQRNGILCIAFGPNGEFLVSSDKSGLLEVWNVKSGTIHCTLDADAESFGVRSIAFSSDGILASYKRHDRRIKLWNLETATFHKGKKRNVKSIETKVINRVSSGLCFSPDGKTLVSQNSTRVVAYSVDNLAVLWSKDTTTKMNISSGKLKISFSPTGEYIALSFPVSFNSLIKSDIFESSPDGWWSKWKSNDPETIKVKKETIELFNRTKNQFIVDAKTGKTVFEMSGRGVFLPQLKQHEEKKKRKQQNMRIAVLKRYKKFDFDVGEKHEYGDAIKNFMQIWIHELTISKKKKKKKSRKQSSSSSSSGISASADASASAKRALSVSPQPSPKRIRSETSDNPILLITDESSVSGASSASSAVARYDDDGEEVDTDDEDIVFPKRKAKSYSPLGALDDDDDAKQSPAELYASYIEAENVDALSSIPAEYITRDLIESAIRKNNPMILGLLLRKIGPLLKNGME